MKIPLILLFSGLSFILLGGAWIWQEIVSYKMSIEKGERKRWWLEELNNVIFFSFDFGVLGSIGCFLFGVLLVVLGIIGFNHGLAFQK